MTYIVLLSGGMDSLAALQKTRSYNNGEVKAIHFRSPLGDGAYKAAIELCRVHGVPAVTKEASQLVPDKYFDGLLGGASYYLPDRNLLYLTWASMYAKFYKWEPPLTFVTGFCEGSADIYDITPKFVEGVNWLLGLDWTYKAQVWAPFAGSSKAQVLNYLVKSNASVRLTYSCFTEETLHCGECPACVRRKESFKEVGIDDPTEYRV